MGTHTEDYYGADASRGTLSNRGNGESREPSSPTSAGAQRPVGSRGKITSRPSRDSILQSYAAQDAQRARNARMYSQAVSQVYQESASRASDRAAQRAALETSLREQERLRAAQRAQEQELRRARAQGQGSSAQAGGTPDRRQRVRVVPPLSSQESYDRTRSSQASYERARASRDVLSESRIGRTSNREVIDGRGSIDSRAFNENNELVGYSIDERDRPRAAVDGSFSQTRWHSRAGQGFSDVPDSGAARSHRARRASEKSNVGFSGGVMSGRANYTAPRGFAALPLFVKIAIPVIIVLAVVLIALLVL